MKNHPRFLKWLGLLGGLFWIILIVVFYTEWGASGTSQYIAYQNYNRLWSPILLLMLLGFVGLYRHYPFHASRIGQIGLGLIIFGFVLMMAGNIAEFWIFTDVHYGAGLNPRNLSWYTFLFGWLFTLVGALFWGIHSIRTHILPQWAGSLLILTLPLTIASIVLFFSQSILLPTAVAVVSLSVSALRVNIDDALAQTKL